MERTTYSPSQSTLLGIHSLADFLSSISHDRPMSVLWSIVEIIGVMIGLKPATMVSFDLSLQQVAELRTSLASLGLRVLFEEVSLPNSAPDRKAYMIFVSCELAVVEELRSARQASLALGWCPENPEDQNLTLKIGQLLGYPKTATEYFAFGPRNKRGIIKHRLNSERDRYYVHSPENFRAEYEQFEDILHPAVEQFCPEVAAQLRQDTTKYWTSADL